MTYLRRSLTILALVLGTQLADAKTLTYSGDFWEHVGLITTTWWITTLVVTILLGILIGYFVYRSAVSNGRAGGATGAGCLVAVVVFLCCQAVAVVLLAITLFNLPVDSGIQSKDASNPAASGIDTSTPPKKPNAPAKNNGDDF